MEWLINIMETQGPQLVAMRADADERLTDRRIREEQDAAYQVSCVRAEGSFALIQGSFETLG